MSVRTMARWEPLRDLVSLQEDLSRLFGGSFGSGDMSVSRSSWTPYLDMFENGDAYVVKVDVPGVRPDDVDVTVDQNVLSIRGERRSTDEIKDEAMHRIERRFGAFHRTISLPTTVDIDGIQASYLDGVLTITIPKAEQAKPRRIKIGEGARELNA
ncbi:MAG TPA: Hsp20/alpha crystallin family protein [Actinomycetota bacterium]|nr:Hsp20/alpha crystallin family protein [Actinomycetota bacterium]